MTRVLEIRTYRLKPGTIDVFHAAMRDKAVPFIRSKGMDVVAFGASDHEEETYFLIRAYASRRALETEQNAFYNSAEWQAGPRGDLVAYIESYLNTLVALDDVGVENLRALNSEQARRSSLLS